MTKFYVLVISGVCDTVHVAYCFTDKSSDCLVCLANSRNTQQRTYVGNGVLSLDGRDVGVIIATHTVHPGRSDMQLY